MLHSTCLYCLNVISFFMLCNKGEGYYRGAIQCVLYIQALYIRRLVAFLQHPLHTHTQLIIFTIYYAKRA